MQLLRKLLFPFSLLYALVVYLRNYMYDKGFLSSHSYDVPIFCIGNLSVGGTGKTPMTEYLIELLKPHYKIAVLSRGYGRKSVGFLLADGNSTVEQLGDEPFQIHKKFPEVPIAVDTDRRNGIRLLMEKVAPELIVLDDAFQHRKVAPNYSFLLTAYDDLYIDDWYLPTGNLRDIKKAANRADCIIVTKCPPSITEKEMITIEAKLKPLAHQVVHFSYLEYDSNIIGLNIKQELKALKEGPFTLVTGIANPSPVVGHLSSKKLNFEHLVFKDHHFFTKKELDILRKKELILTTEKDFVRLKEHVENLYYLPIKHQFIGGGKQKIFDVIKLIMKGRS